jgi:hypothetical protein
MTAWIWRLHIIVPAAERETANALAPTIGPGWAEDDTFGVPLAAIADPHTITHYGCNTLATEAMRGAMFGAASPTWLWMLIDAASGALLGTYAEPPPPVPPWPIIAPAWDWHRTLDYIGLVPHEPEEIT